MTYDYIIVGAGSAGCVLASRLSEDAGASVLLLEAGGPDKAREIHIPATFSRLFKTPVDWSYYTEEQPHLNNRKLFWPRGKMLGGSSSMNAMIYIRGNAFDYDRWRQLGNEGWSYDELLPYFRKAENQERGPSFYHGSGGPLNVADARSVSPLSLAFVRAAVEEGIPFNDDFNGPEQEGANLFQVTQKGGRRHSAAGAYLRPALSRSNLSVRTHALVTSLSFEEGRAVGVSYVAGGRAEYARAGGEIILCGGAINTPQLLMLSGVGPAEQLKSLGIPLNANLPGVGGNLQDHLFAAVAYVCTQPITLDTANTLRNVLKYLLFRKGPLTSNVAEAGAFIKTRPHLPAPDLQLHFGPVYHLHHGFIKPGGNGFTFGVTLIGTQSRGRITLRSADPQGHPIIQPNYLASEDDLRVLIEGVHLARRIAKASPFDPFRGAELYPGADSRSDAEIAEFIRETVETIYHPVGTCKMGHDAMSVVDDRLKVHGFDNLRVADASIMPVIVSGNPNAAVIMIAEKAADLIKEG